MAAELKRPAYALELGRVLKTMYPGIAGIAEMTLFRPEATQNVTFVGIAPCRIVASWPADQSVMQTVCDLTLDIVGVSLNNDTWQMLTAGKASAAYFTDLFDLYTVRSFTAAAHVLSKITFGEFIHSVAKERYSFEKAATVSGGILFEGKWRVLINGSVGVWLSWSQSLNPILVPHRRAESAASFAAALAAAATQLPPVLPPPPPPLPPPPPPFPFHPGVPFPPHLCDAVMQLLKEDVEGQP